MVHFTGVVFLVIQIITFYSPSTALGSEFNDLCAFSLSQGKMMRVSCVINETIDNKVYCFASQVAKTEFLKDPFQNIQKASQNFLEIKTQLDDGSDLVTGAAPEKDDKTDDQLQRRFDRNIISPGARDDKELEWEKSRDF